MNTGTHTIMGELRFFFPFLKQLPPSELIPCHLAPQLHYGFRHRHTLQFWLIHEVIWYLPLALQ